MTKRLNTLGRKAARLAVVAVLVSCADGSSLDGGDAAVVSAALDTDEVLATADTTIRSTSVDFNDGGEKFLTIESTRPALVNFDASAIATLLTGRELLSARLVLHAASWPCSDEAFSVHRMNQPFDGIRSPGVAALIV